MTTSVKAEKKVDAAQSKNCCQIYSTSFDNFHVIYICIFLVLLVFCSYIFLNIMLRNSVMLGNVLRKHSGPFYFLLSHFLKFTQIRILFFKMAKQKKKRKEDRREFLTNACFQGLFSSDYVQLNALESIFANKEGMINSCLLNLHIIIAFRFASKNFLLCMFRIYNGVIQLRKIEQDELFLL